MNDLSFKKLWLFYINNPVILCFTIANLIFNIYFSVLLSDTSTPSGVWLCAGAIFLSVAITFAVSLLGMGSSYTYIKKRYVPFALVFVSWIAFTLADMGMSWMSTTARFETSRLIAEKQTALNNNYQQIAQGAASTIAGCWGLPGCNSQSRIDSAERATAKLEASPIAWSPYSAFSGDFIGWIISILAVISSLGSGIIGFLVGLGVFGENVPVKREELKTEPKKNRPDLRAI
jgi:hypothetical protein